MKMYRLIWLYTLASLLYTAALPLGWLGWEAAGRPWALVPAFACFAAGMAGLWGLHGLLSWKHPRYQYPTPPEASPVGPSGTWVAPDEPLVAGS